MTKYQDKARGMLVGLAVGDALLAMPECPILRARFEDTPNFKEPE